ncbi:MAG: hypothetical protein A3K19_16855 [Lentisphaerae bacterium RIFOXYB12_FULL_65_16]|nr:MAG: hypothetical protein A3K18_17815 [Lentisphaerae bacterium RIFOXYA12_64_32]OGV88917.1 MAG: hypothetical protein A3K19_16855 [Lentisphaerae bacterium RIFOXYB12_FULL_65_16]
MDDAKTKILIVDDEQIKRTILEDELQDAGYAVTTAANPLAAAPFLAKTAFDVILTDLRMPGQDGLSFLRDLKQQNPEQPVMVMTAYGTVATAIEAMKLGAWDYLQKPFATEELLIKLDKLLRYERLTDENQILRQQLARTSPTPNIIVGASPVIRTMLDRVRILAGLDTTVLVEGESGTGKELVARTIHETSLRASGPFVAVSCAALPRELIESELFGHEAGAFTGATKRRLGRFECAHGGTIFLDDVDDIPLETQVKLLRVLQERIVDRVGSEQGVRTNVRVIAATKSSLADLVAARKFRDDLYYRLSVVPIHIPPLRERREDIPLLVQYFLERLALTMNRGPLSITPDALATLQAHDWPGNVRELEHIVERMIALCPNDEFTERDVPPLRPSVQIKEHISLALEGVETIDMAAVLAETEERLVKWAVERANGNLARAAEMLRMPRSTLQYKVNKLQGERPLASPE